jgi:hypothetical protein
MDRQVHDGTASGAYGGLEQFQSDRKGSAALLEGDCGVADARQGTTLSALGALHSPPIHTADRFATLTVRLKLL